LLCGETAASWPERHVSPVTASLDPILRPRSIAVIGAARNENTIGHQIVANLVQNGFTGPVYPVNPKARAIHSLLAYASVGDIVEPPDLAVIALPKELVRAAADECGRAGVRGLIVVSAGFREVGEAGRRLEEELMLTVRSHGMRIVGPNCLGVINTDPAMRLNATFAPVMPPSGAIGFVSQSGALGLSILDYAREYGLGFAQFVSVGNKPDVSGNDLLLEWEHDARIEVILMYVESFGNPRRFLEIATRITRQKPIIVLKSGRSSTGARAAASHTGALAASDVVVSGLLEQAGVLRAGSIEELFDMAAAFGARALPASRRTAVLTNSGGPGILAADALEAQGFELPELQPASVAKLAPVLAQEATLKNPLDMIASAKPPAYRAALEVLLADEGVDSIVAIFVPPLGVRQEDVAEAICAATCNVTSKPVVAVLMGLEGLPQGRLELRDAGIPAYVFPESAARALSALYHHGQQRQRAADASAPPTIDVACVSAIVRAARERKETSLSQVDAFAVLEASGIPVVAVRLAHNEDEAATHAAALGYPVAMKIVSEQILHKTEVNGVRLGVNSNAEARSAFLEIIASAKQGAPEARIDGVLIQPMVGKGRELIAGVSRDKLFGPLVMCGLGGIFVEALHDVVFRLAPIDQRTAREMIAGMRGARILESFRGQPAVDARAVADVLVRLGALAVACDDITEIDVNPLSASAEGVIAVDARILLG
jgi:acetyl coenzyme A synthetase (ADP forming)-like protein